MIARPGTTYAHVQCSLALSFLILLACLALLKNVDGGLEVRGTTMRLPVLCHAEVSPCPSCGLTKGLVAAIAFDFETARAMHPAAIALLLVLCVQGIGRLALAGAAIRRGIAGRRAMTLGIIDFVIHFGVVTTLLNSRP